MPNLDFECATVGAGLSNNTDEDTVRKCLGVLQENGVYACFLYALSLKNSKGQSIIEALANLLKTNIPDAGIPDSINTSNINEAFKKLLGEDIDRLFLAKWLMETTLTYTLYHLRALPSSTQMEGAN